MKRFFAALAAFLVASIMIMPVQAFAADSNHPSRVVDDGNLLSEAEENNLKTLVDEISERQHMDVVIVTVNGIGDSKNIRAFADDYYDYNGYGVGMSGDRSGILLVVDCESGERYLSLRGDAIKAISDDETAEIASRVKPKLENGDFADAFTTYANMCDRYMTSYRNSLKFPFVRNLLISLGIALIIALIVTSTMRGQLKSVRANNLASDYVVPGSLNVEQSYEIYLYSKVNAVSRSNNNDSGGSKTHTSSSGATHSGRSF